RARGKQTSERECSHPLSTTKNRQLLVVCFFVFYNAELAINGLLGYSGVEANFLICNKKREELAFFSSVPPQGA
ncbi:MAG: hypothetical protein IKZ32_00685, partial [Alistipes sp.]|nr:hypothetical protein [Alistipes sp.]